ncbi:MAG: ATPase [Devosia sp.]|uniref:sensor histidine kinase n=1 Tax=Devosia sp. TaxID=1871048 RepID=UPI0024C9893D|nr:ATP-binding protein [Devosia sp.]UYO01186.1 MAG: ATPase [Devosia sp.]
MTAVTLLCVATFVIVSIFATSIPRLGLKLVPGPLDDGVYVVGVEQNAVLDGPALVFPSELIAIAAASTPDQAFAVEPIDLIPEADTLPSYPELRRFLDRQQALFDILTEDRVELHLRDPASNDIYTVLAEPSGVPLWRLPDGFWVQLLTGIASMLIAGWVWALRPHSLGPAFFAATAVGMLMATGTLAIYANRELAISGTLFKALMPINHIGTMLFGIAMVALLLTYPRRIVPPAWLLVLPIMIGIFLFAELNEIGPGPFQLYGAVAVLMAAILVAIALQWWHTRDKPSDRAALGWLGLSVVAGSGAYTILGAAPVLLGIPFGLPQSHVTGVLIVIYVGLALGLSRYRLFELGDWAYRVLFYTIGVVLLLVIDAGLIFLLQFETAPALGVSLLLVGFVYLPARDWIWRRLTARRRIEQDELFSAALEIAFAPSPDDGAREWRALLQRLFDPLEIEPVTATTTRPAVSGDGLALDLPAVGGSPPLRVTFPFGGRGLFSPAHLKLATNLVTLTERAEESRLAYMRGVGEERRRMARDLHDDVGARLLTGLHTADEQTRPTLQAALSDIRAIVSGLAGEEASLDRVLAATRHEAARRLEAAGIVLDWPLPEAETEAVRLDYRLHKALASSVREIVSNVIRHSGATTLTVTQAVRADGLDLQFADDGRGLSEDARSGETGGYGLRSLRTRIEDVGGQLGFGTPRSGAGTEVSLAIPLRLATRTPEPGVQSVDGQIDFGT